MKKKGMMFFLVFCIVLFSTPVFAIEFPSLGESLNTVFDVGRGFSIDTFYTPEKAQFIDALVYAILLYTLLYGLVFSSSEKFKEHPKIATTLPLIISLVCAFAMTSWAYSRSPPFMLLTSLGPWLGLGFFAGVLALVYYACKHAGVSGPYTFAFVLMGFFILLESPLGEPLTDLLAYTGAMGQIVLGILALLQLVAIVALIYWLVIKLPLRMFGKSGIGDITSKFKKTDIKPAEEPIIDKEEDKVEDMAEDIEKTEKAEVLLERQLENVAKAEGKTIHQLLDDMRKLIEVCEKSKYRENPKKLGKAMNKHLRELEGELNQLKQKEDEFTQIKQRINQLKNRELKILYQENVLEEQIKKHPSWKKSNVDEQEKLAKAKQYANSLGSQIKRDNEKRMNEIEEKISRMKSLKTDVENKVKAAIGNLKNEETMNEKLGKARTHFISARDDLEEMNDMHETVRKKLKELKKLLKKEYIQARVMKKIIKKIS